MYEVHPDDQGRWVLYNVDRGFSVVAWFADREDAEFARDCFQKRDKPVREPTPEVDLSVDPSDYPLF